MAEMPHISLEQWRALMAVVEAGGYAQAAEALHKSQSSVTYAVQKLESLLGVKAFEIQGRKAILTPTGKLLYRRARTLLGDAVDLERAARKLSAGWEAEIHLAVDIIFPTWLLLKCLDRFNSESPHTRLNLIESVLSGTTEALLHGQADLAIAAQVPSGFMGQPLMRLRFLPVAHPDHPLHQLNRELTVQDLHGHRHLVVRDSGVKRTDRLTVQVEQRWTVGHMTTSIEAARSGYGFAWFPEEKIRKELAEGSLKPLPLRDGGDRYAELYLIYADRDAAGPGTQRLAQIIVESVASECMRHSQTTKAGT